MLDQQLRQSRAAAYESVLADLPRLPPKAYRWVPEMLEISRTLSASGITPKVLQGAADIYAFVADTMLGKESPEAAREKARSGADVVRSLAQEHTRK